MSGILNILLGAVILLVIMVIFVFISAKHKENGLGDACSGNCASCSAGCKGSDISNKSAHRDTEDDNKEVK